MVLNKKKELLSNSKSFPDGNFSSLLICFVQIDQLADRRNKHGKDKDLHAGLFSVML